MTAFRNFAGASALSAMVALGCPAAMAGGSIRDAARPFSWSGFYVGAAVGYGIGIANDNVHDSTSDGGDTFSQRVAAIQGAQGIVSAGYDVQVSQRVVAGLLIDYAFGATDGRFDADVDRRTSIDKQLAIGARVGYLLAPNTQLFATAGWTRAEFETRAQFEGEFREVTKSTNGFFVGGGLEQALTNNWSLKLEYRFSDYRAFTLVREFIDGDGDTVTNRDKFDTEVHSVRLGVNYKFGR